MKNLPHYNLEKWYEQARHAAPPLDKEEAAAVIAPLAAGKAVNVTVKKPLISLNGLLGATSLIIAGVAAGFYFGSTGSFNTIAVTPAKPGEIRTTEQHTTNHATVQDIHQHAATGEAAITNNHYQPDATDNHPAKISRKSYRKSLSLSEISDLKDSDRSPQQIIASAETASVQTLIPPVTASEPETPAQTTETTDPPQAADTITMNATHPADITHDSSKAIKTDSLVVPPVREKKNVLRADLCGLGYPFINPYRHIGGYKLTIGYDRQVNKHIALGASFNYGYTLPSVTTYDYAVVPKGWWLNLEARYYTGDKTGKGFFAAPYLTYAHLSAKVFKRSTEPFQEVYAEKWNMLCLGGVTGYRFVLNKKIIIEPLVGMIFAGGQYVKPDYSRYSPVYLEKNLRSLHRIELNIGFLF